MRTSNLPSNVINIRVFFFPLSRYRHAWIKLYQKKCYNSPKKQINTISNTEWKWKVKLLDHKILFYYFVRSFLCNKSFQKLWSWLTVWCMSYVAFLLSAWRHQENSVSVLETPWKRLDALRYLLDDRKTSLSMFLLRLGVYIFHYKRSKLVARTIPVLTDPKNLLFSQQGIYLSLCPIYFELR